MYKIRFREPENLKLREQLDADREYLNEQKMRDAPFMFIVNSLIKSKENSENKMKKGKTPWAPLSTKILDRIVYNYPKYLRYLLAKGILVTNNHFLPGKAKGYRFGDEYEGRPYHEYVITDKKLWKSLEREKRLVSEEDKKSLEGKDFMADFFKSGGLKIDDVQANNYIDRDLELKIHNALLSEGSITWKKSQIQKTKNGALHSREIVSKIKENNLGTGRISGEGKRFYHVFTNLKKELRQFLSYDGLKLVEVDKKNSHPYCSLALFHSTFWSPYDGKNQIKFQYLISKEIYNRVVNNNKYKSIITLVKQIELKWKDDPRINEYKDLVLTGDLYGFLQENFLPIFPSRFDTRPKVKKQLMIIMYSDPAKNTKALNTPAVLFASYFPEIAEVFKLIQELEELDHKTKILSILLQRIESFLIIENCCRRIKELHPEISITALHDSIITTEGNQAIVEGIMNEEIYSLMGYKPRVKFKEMKETNTACFTIREDELLRENWQETRGRKAKMVKDTCTGELFPSVIEASYVYNYTPNKLRAILNGKEINTTCLQYLAA